MMRNKLLSGMLSGWPSGLRGAALWLILVSLMTPYGLALAQDSLPYHELLAMDRAAFRQRPVALMPSTSPARQQIAYGDRYAILRVVELDSRGQARELWRSRALDGPILQVLIEDLDGDGGVELIARTAGALYVYDENFDQRWESLNEGFRQVQALAIGNVDQDESYELVILADNQLRYIDGATFASEFRGTQNYTASEIAIGNVDTDLNLELVLNTGFVLDASLGEAEWRAERFGEFVELLDIDGDGLQEILGWSPGTAMKIFDADEKQEKALR